MQTNKPVCPDAFTAPLSEAAIQGRSAEVEYEEKSAVKYAAEGSDGEAERSQGAPQLDKATSWVETVKGQAFWVLRSLATVID